MSVPDLVPPAVQRLLYGMTDVPALVMNGRGDVLATNPLGRALYAPMLEAAGGAVPKRST
ncbi:hypothetical protein [Dactylosporangium sp. NPDC000521]|uniref:MmyB family transcriptional regulator n=1 Tax=Dactylosporangium sp. NPDC000521 TaxID=3363975 RepID=UPI0036B20147